MSSESHKCQIVQQQYYWVSVTTITQNSINYTYAWYGFVIYWITQLTHL
jgi:hypothetical protein